MIARERITHFFEFYEDRFDVSRYELFGKPIWPVTRMMLSQALYAGILPKAHSASSGMSTKRPVRFFRLKIIPHAAGLFKKVARKKKRPYKRASGSEIVEGGRINSQQKPCSVLLISYENRRIAWGGGSYNTIMDPMREALEEKNVRSILWERGTIGGGDGRLPSWKKEKEKFLKGEISRTFRKELKKTFWFHTLQQTVIDEMGVVFPWNYLEKNIRRIFYFSSIVEKWLNQMGFRLVIIDCWYNMVCLAFTNAARGQGIPVMDLQHGLQGENHFAYQGWKRKPRGGYDFIPQKFWVWGTDDAGQLARGGICRNPTEDIIVGGNLWLNKWRRADDPVIKETLEKARRLRHGFEKAILVTLQTRVDNLELVRETIRKSPPQWLWLIRPHRSQAAFLAEFEDFFRKTGHPGVNLRDAFKLPLYTLFQQIDVHLTGFSTCALEALAFNVRTVVIHESGREAFRGHIKKNEMIYADSLDEIIAAIELIAKNRFTQDDIESERIFAGYDLQRKAIEKIARQVCSLERTERAKL